MRTHINRGISITEENNEWKKCNVFHCPISHGLFNYLLTILKGKYKKKRSKLLSLSLPKNREKDKDQK